MQRLIWIFLLFIGVLGAEVEPRARYYANCPEPIDVNFKITVSQKIQGHTLESSLAGYLSGSLELQKENISEGGVIKGLPDRVVLTIQRLDGECRAGDQKICYSSASLVNKGRQVASVYERAAASLVGIPLKFAVQIDHMAGCLRFEDQGELENLTQQIPAVREIFMIATVEALLQQILAPLYPSQEQWQRLANTISVPVNHKWEKKEFEIAAETEGNFVRARTLLSRPLKGTLVGKGRWKSANGLHFKTEQQTCYTAQLEGAEGEKLEIQATWVIQGTG